MKLAPKLLAPVFGLGVALLFVVTVAIMFMRDIERANAEVQHAQAEIAEALEVRSISRAVQRDALNAVLSSNPQDTQDYAKRTLARIESQKQHTATLVGLLQGADVETMRQFGALQATVGTEVSKVLDLAVAGKGSEAYAYFGDKVRGAERTASDLTDKFITAKTQEIKTLTVKAQDAEVFGEWMLIATALTTLLLATGTAIAVVMWGVVRPTRNLVSHVGLMSTGELDKVVPGATRKDELGDIGRALDGFRLELKEGGRLREEAEVNRIAAEKDRRARAEAEQLAAQAQAHVVTCLAQGLERLADGNLTFRIADAFPDDYVKLKEDFNGAIERLENAVSIIASNATSIRGGTGEISTATDDMSKRIEQQAASLEETAAALEQISVTVKKTAEGASKASSAAANAKGQAEQSRAVVNEAVEAMSRIEASAREISQIIGVIDEIAFQTNLLALNAGVEAARAGDAGKGFAVVAQEVRALAQRSAEAAKEIKGLILTSSTQVGSGVELVNRTGTALVGIVQQFEVINSLVAEIAASANEQASAISQVNVAVSEIDRTTQQNAAMVEESTAASRSLAEETAQLAALVGRFEVSKRPGEHDEDDGARHHARQAPSRAVPPRPAMSRMGGARPQAAVARKPEPSREAESWEEF